MLFGTNVWGEIRALEKSQAVIRFTPQGKILDANENFCDAMGYKMSEIKGMHHSLFVDPSYASSDAYKKFWQELSAGKFKAEEFKRYAKGGKEIWIQASYNPVRNIFGQVESVVKFATDITEAKQKAADHAGQLEAISKSQAVIEFDMQGNILNANNNFCNAVNYTLSEIKGKHHSIFVDSAYAASEEYHQFWENLRAGNYAAGEYQRFGKGGSTIWIQASYNPIFDQNGKAFKVVKYATNITNRVKMQENVASYVIGSTQSSQELTEYIRGVSAAAEEMISSIAEISNNTNNAASMTERAVSVITDTDNMINSLKQKSQQIGDILNMVGEIANQTNLLALNATIEAARAGELGKGFAVVANEVKELAGKTSEATDQIQDQIRSIQDEVDNALVSMQNATNAIQDVNSITTSIAGAIEEQRTVTNDIGESMQRANDQVTLVSQNITEINQAVGQL